MVQSSADIKAINDILTENEHRNAIVYSIRSQVKALWGNV